MKVPLRFQATEYDCGTVSLLNAFSYLYEREELPGGLVWAINKYTLDSSDEEGNKGQGGTSKEAILKLTHWITKFASEKDFGVKCIRLEGEDVNFENIFNCIKNKGVVFIRCWQTCEHYVIITQMNKKYAFIFDSYYLDKNEYKEDEEVKIIFNKPFSQNRRVKLTRLFSETKKDFSLGKIKDRECVLINKK